MGTEDNALTGTMFNDNVELTQFECYYTAVDAFHSRCFNVGQNDFALRMLTLLSTCASEVSLLHRLSLPSRTWALTLLWLESTSFSSEPIYPKSQRYIKIHDYNKHIIFKQNKLKLSLK